MARVYERFLRLYIRFSRELAHGRPAGKLLAALDRSHRWQPDSYRVPCP